MDNKKIDKIGEKLNVNSSVIKPTKSPNCFKKHSFWMIHTTSFVLSSLMGLFFGLSVKNSSFPNYPFAIEVNKTQTSWGVISINTVNGIITIPQKRYFNLGRMMRFGIAILSFLVSFAISHAIYDSIISSIPPSGSSGLAIAYNVYKSPLVNVIQNQKVFTKD